MALFLERLRRDHANFDRVLNTFEKQIALLNSSNRVAALERMTDIVWYFQSYADQWHHPAEDALYRHLLMRGIEPDAQRSIGVILEDHVALKRKTLDIERLFASVTEQSIPVERIVESAADYLEIQREHMRFENERLFPLAERCLTADEWHALERSYPMPHDPRFNTTVKDSKRRWKTSVKKTRPKAEV
jgi:hemerythrin-like domain-containing protein